MAEIRIGGHTVETSHTDKVLFPGDGITKGDLIDYYKRIAGVMVKYLKARPVSMQRFPDGIDQEAFFQKETPDYFPSWIHTVTVEVKEGGTQSQITIEDAATLVYLANQACITPHVWLSTADHLDRPDRMIFDLDPAGDDFKAVRKAARDLRDLLEGDLGLTAYAMTTGSRGIHVVVPLDAKWNFDSVRDFAGKTAGLLAARNPKTLTTEPRKDKRRGRIFVDYLRNAYAQTAAPPYAVRAKKSAPVATPVAWDEVENAGLGPRKYTIENIFQRLGKTRDPWSGMMRHAKSLEAPLKRLDRLVSESA
jgi:bifunctional non-homologous end joining protein LigD